MLFTREATGQAVPPCAVLHGLDPHGEELGICAKQPKRGLKDLRGYQEPQPSLAQFRVFLNRELQNLLEQSSLLCV